MALKINYKDDGFTGNRKYRMVTNPDNTVSFEDVTAYNPVGDSFGAADINNTNIALNNLSAPAFEDYTSAAAPDPETALVNIKSKAALTVLLSNIKTVLKGVVFKKHVLANMDQVMANTASGRLADALAVKALNSNLGIQFRSVRSYVQCKIQTPLAAYATISITKDISNFGFTKPPIALLSSTYLCSSTVRLITTSILEVTISNLLNYASADCFASYTLLETK